MLSLPSLLHSLALYFSSDTVLPVFLLRSPTALIFTIKLLYRPRQCIQGQLLDGLALGNLPKLSAAVVDLARDVLAVELDSAEQQLSKGVDIGKLTDKLRNVLDALKAVMLPGPVRLTLFDHFWNAYAYPSSLVATAEIFGQ